MWDFICIFVWRWSVVHTFKSDSNRWGYIWPCCTNHLITILVRFFRCVLQSLGLSGKIDAHTLLGSVFDSKSLLSRNFSLESNRCWGFGWRPSFWKDWGGRHYLGCWSDRSKEHISETCVSTGAYCCSCTPRGCRGTLTLVSRLVPGVGVSLWVWHPPRLQLCADFSRLMVIVFVTVGIFFSQLGIVISALVMFWFSRPLPPISTVLIPHTVPNLTNLTVDV